MDSRGPVLAAVDLSKTSGPVLRCAYRAAARLRTGLAVFHAVDGLTSEEESALLLPRLRRRVEQARREARSSLGELLDAVGLGRLEALQAEIVPGPAHDAILERAAQLGALLVVVGGPHPHVLHGSTAERVVRRSSCPVLVARRPPDEGYRRLLVGVDGSPGSEQAWAAASALAEEGATMTACHVVEAPVAAAQEGRARTALEGWVCAWAGGSTARLLIEHGSPRAALAAAADREGADLLAVGRGGLRGLAEVLLGSVAERAVAVSRCDVLAAGDEEP